MGIFETFVKAEEIKKSAENLLAGLEKKAKYFPIQRAPAKISGHNNTGRRGVRTKKPSAGRFN